MRERMKSRRRRDWKMRVGEEGGQGAVQEMDLGRKIVSNEGKGQNKTILIGSSLEKLMQKKKNIEGEEHELRFMPARE